MAGPGRVWFHKQLGRMETEKLLMESKSDGSFIIRESDTVRGAYVLSTIYQQRIHHYRIIPGDEGRLSIQAQQGVQKKQFVHLEDLVEYYSHSRRGLVCALTIPIPQRKDEEVIDDGDDSDDDTTDGGGSREQNIVSKFLLAFLSTVDTSKVDESFRDQLHTYLNKDVSVDIESMKTPTPQLICLKQLFRKDCILLHKQLNKIMVQAELMRSLFERAGGAKDGSDIVSSIKRKKSFPNDMDYDSLTFKLNDCGDSITSLETIAFQMLRELSGSMSGGISSSSSLQQAHPITNGSSCGGGVSPKDRGDEEEVMFEVKMDQGIAGRKNVTIIVNLKECKFQFFKPGDTQRTTYEHNQLLQLVKSRSRDTKLSVAFEGGSRKEYIFGDMQSRETFCQLTQLIRNRKLAGEDQDSISVFVGTWNMGDAGPPGDISSWIQSSGQGKTLPTALSQAHDVYAFGTQETSIAEKDWTTKIRQTLKSTYDMDYEKVVCQSLWGMRCLVMAKPEHIHKIAHVQTSSVKTGIGNTLGNKGGVGISFFFGSMSLCFICSHLTSGNEKCSRRNQNYHDILKGMSNLKQKRLNQFDMTNQFTHLFFFGDLNYRVELGATEIVEYAKQFNHYSIYLEDQLRKEVEKKSVFVGFEECPILFPPTYRYQRGTRTLDDYVWVKQKRSGIRINVPSYCDRVLWRSYPGSVIVNTSYGCTMDITTSDHSPVFSTYQLRGFKQYVSDSGSGMEVINKKAHIVVLNCNAKIATTSKTNFYMEFHSPCFEGTIKTTPNNDFKVGNDSESYTWPIWKTRDSLAVIKPIVTEEAYLKQQHLLVMLKGQEGDEPYAECCISLRDVIGPEPMMVVRELIHQRHSVGEIEISIHVILDTYQERKAEEELYTDINFITQEEPMSSLDKPGANRHSHSEPENSRGATAAKKDPPVSRPMLPIPRTNSQSAVDHHQPSLPGMQTVLSTSLPPPPLPSRRREMATIGASPSATQRSVTMTHPPPTVPVRRTETTSRGFRPDVATKPETSDKNMDVSRQRGASSPSPSTSTTAPIPVKRKTNTKQGSLTAPTPVGDHSPSFPQRSKTPTDPLPPLPIGAGPPVPKRLGGARSSRPPSTVEALLQFHNLQHFSSILLSNGYDDLHFLAEVPEHELQEIGITQSGDREKLLKVFKQHAQNQ